MAKGEFAHYEQFLPLSQCFQMSAAVAKGEFVHQMLSDAAALESVFMQKSVNFIII